jgi:hypothetical protein
MDSRKEIEKIINSDLSPCRGCQYNRLSLDGWVYCTKGKVPRKVFFLKYAHEYRTNGKLRCIYPNEQKEEDIEWIAEKKI